ncbi:MAG: V-type ATP synthase subunit E [Bacteroidota bacterium]
MQNKLQELTDKIYKEGLEKGNEEAERIIAVAKEKADKIISEANEEKNRIISEAEKKSKETAENSKAELKLSFNQALSGLKQDVVNIIDDKIVNNLVTDSFKETEFIQTILETVIENWNPSESGSVDINVLLPVDKQAEMDKFFKSRSKEILDKGVIINYSDNLKSGFEIAPKDGGYKISFTDQVFENFLKDYLRPKLFILLFGEK